MTYQPGRGPCYRCLYPEVPDGLVPNCADAGVLGVLPGVVGTIQATEAIKLIVGAGDPLGGRLLVYDALEMAFREFRVERRDDCRVCGDRPTIKAPMDPPGELCRTAGPAEAVRRLRPAELRQLLQAGERPLLLDVREPREFAAGHIAGSLNLPLPELAARLQEIPAGAAPVFICRSGARSATACGIAIRAGVQAASNLDGGLLAWAAEVDSSMVVAPAR
jgi:adenylyltransferase/sulfurtransferase